MRKKSPIYGIIVSKKVNTNNFDQNLLIIT